MDLQKFIIQGKAWKTDVEINLTKYYANKNIYNA